MKKQNEDYTLPTGGLGTDEEKVEFAPCYGARLEGGFAFRAEGGGLFIPCPCCGAEIAVTKDAARVMTIGEAVRYALDGCGCTGAEKARAERWDNLITDTPCTSDMLARGVCGYTGGKSPCSKEVCSAWDLGRYDRALFVKGWKLWQQEREAEAFKPTAQMLAAVLAGPEPAPYWTAPKFPTGVCAYCGQTILLAEPATSAEDADEKATAICQCAAGEAARRHLFERDTIESLFPEISARATALLCEVAALVRTEHLKSGTAIKPWDNVTAKFKLKDGVVTITRTEKREHQQSL